MPSETVQYDLVVIGGGPGGYTAAIRAAQAGLRCALVEQEEHLGGVCLHWGCIPTKGLLRAAEIYRLVRGAGQFGVRTGEVAVDWDQVVGRSRSLPPGLARGVAGLMKRHGIAVRRGRGRLTPGRQVEVLGADGQVAATLTSPRVLLATGGAPRSLPGVAVDGERIWSSRHALAAPACPRSLAVVGAGPVGVELACFFATFGSQVTLIEAAPQVLPHEDEELAALLGRALESQGIAVRTGLEVVAAAGRGPEAIRLQVRDRAGGAATEVEAERALVAVGVVGNTAGLGLEALGVRTRHGAVEVDERFQTSAPGIWAVGDLVGPPQLAHAAAAEAAAAVEAMVGDGGRAPARPAIPRCVYSHPQVASVGLTEAAARERGEEVKVGRFPFAASGLARAAGEAEGLVKLVFGARYGELLGAGIVGPQATELIAELGLALTLEATWEELAATVHAHPTLSEAVMEAAGAAFGHSVNI
ncbi:MAG: dihydrolipoyl dehydrogenase [Gemmatimonadota bacterium]